MNIGVILLVTFAVVLAWSVYSILKKGPARKLDGVLKMLGHAELEKSQRKYSVIELGDYTLNNIYVPNGLDNFLQKGLGQPVSIYGQGEMIYAVQLEDGKSYITNQQPNILLIILMLIVGIGTLPVLGLGIIFLLISLKMYGGMRSRSKIKTMVPNALPV